MAQDDGKDARYSMFEYRFSRAIGVLTLEGSPLKSRLLWRHCSLKRGGSSDIDTLTNAISKTL